MSDFWIPRPDQQQVMEFILPRKRAAVWSPPGGGKTVMAATWLEDGMCNTLDIKRVLIVAPKMVAETGWPVQLGLWSHLRHLAADARVITNQDLGRRTGPARRLEFIDKRATKKHLLGLRERIHVCSWDQFPWLAKAYGTGWPYDALVLDESSFVRDQGSDRGRAARHVVQRTGVVEHLLELTATPAVNHEEAAYAQLDLIEPGLLGRNLTDFREQFCLPASRDWRTGQVFSWKVAPAMRGEYERRCASVAVSVPPSLGVPLVEAPVWVDLPDVTRAAYRDMERDLVWSGVIAGSAAVQHLKLRQMASGFVYDDTGQAIGLDTVKMQRLAELVEEIDEPILVAFAFDEELARLRGLFPGQVADIRERGARERFEQGKLRVLAVHPASAGHGVDGLQRVCRHIVWTTVPEDRELYDQTNGRVHRHGTQADTVFCHVLVSRNTVEGDIWREVLPGKLAMHDLLMRATRVRAAEPELAR